MPVTRSDFVHACNHGNVHLHAIVEKDLPLTIFGRVSGQLGFVWAVPDAVHFSICWICDFLQVSGVWSPLLCLSLYDITIILHSLLLLLHDSTDARHPFRLCFARLGTHCKEHDTTLFHTCPTHFAHYFSYNHTTPENRDRSIKNTF